MGLSHAGSAERHEGREHGWGRDEPNKAGALYILEAANASFPDNQTLVLGGVSPTTAFRHVPAKSSARRMHAHFRHASNICPSRTNKCCC